MSCHEPLRGFKKAGGGFTTNRGASIGVEMVVPCGQCTGCRLEHSRQWAMRCVHEAKMHKENCVVSLSYNDENMNEDMSLVKDELSKFCKKLNRELVNDKARPWIYDERFGEWRPYGLRYYGCGEYGERSRRPHYHCVLFGYEPKDKKFYKKSKIGTNLYTSAYLEKLWGKGFVVVGEVDFESCAYVSRYVVDKLTGDLAAMWYAWIDVDGVWHDVLPEYSRMSRRPGIGHGYYSKFGAEVLTHDSVVVRGREVRPPRYYDKLSEAIDPKRMEALKVVRRKKARLHKEDQTPERLRVRERHAILTLRAKSKVEI